MRLAVCMSELAANRKQFHELAETLEREHHIVLDVKELEAEIDSNYAGRDRLSPTEAKGILSRCSQPDSNKLRRRNNR